MSFYDWYCDLPPASPMTWGEQTDVPESADWYNSTFIIAWGSNVPQTRTPDAHFFTEVRYKGAKIVAVTPDYAEVSKLADLWLHPKQGTDAALAMAMGHVILKEFYFDKPCAYFQDYARRYTDLPLLVKLRRHGNSWVPDRFVRSSDFGDRLGQANNPEWKTVAFDERSGSVVVPNGSIGFRWGQKEGEDQGKWNLEEKEAGGRDTKLRLSLIDVRDDVAPVAFPYFGGIAHERFQHNDQGGDVLVRNVPVRKLQLADGECTVACVFDLVCAQYGIDRGLGGNAAQSYDDDVPYTPKWQEAITGVKAQDVITVARQFADNADKTKGKSMIIIGAGMNHWYHADMNYRGVISLLMLCGCVGQSGGGWAHYVGQEKLRPQTGWTALAFALDWHRPPRQQNSTSFFYAHTDQWRYE
jgi:nitrate reductase alpha subunit